MSAGPVPLGPLEPPRVAVPAQIDPALPPANAQVHRCQGRTMGTYWQLSFCGPAGLDTAPIHAAVEAILQQLMAAYSHWEPRSWVTRYAHAPVGSWHAVPPAVLRVLQAALQVARQSGGAFDPTLAQAVQAQGFGTPLPLPTPHQPWRWQDLTLTADKLLQPGGLALDFSGIAKGDVVDQLSALLHQLGLPHHLVDVGGELRGCGMQPDAQPWWVDVEPPSEACDLPRLRVALHGLSVASSGDYRRWRTDAQGERLAHTLHPSDGAPLRGAPALVTVLHPQAMWADAWATALTVLPEDEAMALAQDLTLPVRWVWRPEGQTGWRERISPALEEMLG